MHARNPLVGGALAAFALSPLLAAQDQSLADHFGFDGLEVVKIDKGAGPIAAADLDKDGKTDLIAVNNRNSRIDLHYQRAGASPTDEARAPRRTNEVPEHWRFRREEIPLNEQVDAVLPWDFDGDGRLDLILGSGNPGRIVFLRQSEPGEFTVARKHTVKKLVANRDTLTVADVVGDASPELVGVADGKIQVWPLDGTTLGPAIELGAGGTGIVAFLVEDFNGDGTTDIVGVAPDDAAPIRAWFGSRDGDKTSLGSQHRFEMPPLREASAVEIPGEAGRALCVIERPSKRVVLGRLQPATASTRSTLQTWAFADTSNRKRDTVVGDIDGDGLPDLAATDTEANAIALYRQAKGRGFGSAERFPALADLDFIALGAASGGADVFVSSEKEGVLGRTRWNGSALPFPTTIPLPGGTVPTALGSASIDGKEWVAAVTKDGRNYALELIPAQGDGERVSVPLGSLSRSPDTVMPVDADQDGLTDILLFTPDKPMTMLRHESADAGAPPKFKVLESKDMGQFGLAQAANAKNTAVADIDGDGKPELLVADRNFVRALRYGTDKGWEVVDQINAPRGDAKLVAIALLGEKVLAGDRENDSILSFARGGDGRWSLADTVDAQGFKFTSLAAGDFSGTGKDAILMVGDDGFGVLSMEGGGWEFAQVGTYRSDEPSRVEHEVAQGDLNGDALTDIILLDAGEQMCEILTLSEAQRLLYAAGFEVFESKLFSGGEPREFEPSQALVVDLTGDGANDLVLLCHDRVLLYPQASRPGGAP